jgi:hypothetical protein
MLNTMARHERGQNRLAHVVGLHCDLHPSRSQNMEWFMSIARPMLGQMELGPIIVNANQKRPRS